MKKIICLFVVFVICFLMLVSCSSDVGKVYCLGVSDGGSLDVDIGGFINEEISGYCGDRFYDKSAPATVQVTFMGTTYSGKYSYSNHGALSPLVRDHYSGEGYTFAIVRKTGKLAELDLPSPDVASDALPVACNIDEGEEVAIDFLKNIADVENYKLVDKMTTPYIVGQTLSDEECWGYSYTFVRFVNGIATNDMFDVLLSNRTGKIYSYMSYAVGEFENVSLPANLDIEAAVNDIIAGATEMYSVIDESNATASGVRRNFTDDPKSYILSRTENGGVALAVDVNIESFDRNGKKTESLIRMVKILK